MKFGTESQFCHLLHVYIFKIARLNLIFKLCIPNIYLFLLSTKAKIISNDVNIIGTDLTCSANLAYFLEKISSIYSNTTQYVDNFIEIKFETYLKGNIILSHDLDFSKF